MIDEDCERAVERWVKLGDQLSGRPTTDDRTACARCGSRNRVLDRGREALCAHCYLEAGDQSNAASIVLRRESPARPSPR
jgi:hypothetical protein